MGIEQVNCRAEVRVGGLTIRTPYVQSFTVNKQRGQVSTFNASLKVLSDQVRDLTSAADVVIRAGAKGELKTIFRGICKNAKASPCFDDPSYVLITISGADVLSNLQGKKFTRRCRTMLSSWAAITNVVRGGLKSGMFATSNSEPTINFSDGNMETDSPRTGYKNYNVIDSINESSPNKGGNPKVPIVEVQVYSRDQGE